MSTLPYDSCAHLDLEFVLIQSECHLSPAFIPFNPAMD